jgi:hypothetical protein
VPKLPHDTIKALSVRPLRLYLVLLAEMKRVRNMTVSLTAEEIQERTGIYKQDLAKAKAALKKHSLILVGKDNGETTYTLAHPVKSGPVQYLSYLERDSLTSDQIQGYFLSRIKRLGDTAKYTDNGLKSRCPFCDKKNMLHIQVPKDGALGAGLWKCHSCHASDDGQKAGGSILAFEFLLLTKQPHRAKLLVPKIHELARANVERYFQSLLQTEDDGPYPPSEFDSDEDQNDWEF